MTPIRTVTTVCVALTLLATSTGIAAANPDPHREAVQRQVSAAVASGAAGMQVRVTRDGREFTARAGVAQLGTQRPVPLDGRFRVGSITKTFVTVVTLQLTAEGKLGLDEPVSRYLPGLLPDGERITVRNLLQHTSGLHNYTDDLPQDPKEFMARRFEHRSALELVRAAAAKPLLFPVGTKHSYSNTNFLVAQLLIEKLTGRSWTAAVNQRILQPLRLRDTEAPGDNPFIHGPHARGYLMVEGKPADVSALNPSAAGAAGAMISTTADLDRFLRALLAGRLLAPAQQAELTKLTAVSPDYGLGIQPVPTSCGITVWGHGGGIPGYLSIMLGSADGSRRLEGSVTTGTALDPQLMRKTVDTAVCG
ncbi:serine hydrolase domain-containing protein [Crossiella cryophila]|uniref:D-alanyl-D-alanine carboxypeptidase n=1 Tax=Crossiella cryophila TaxID=43355 RepID=A0A7W7CB39_9PSEU|nr:serine hydrolase domain-containing protein [Crossiella cryophila]MBB4677876.1 D-alanyl-D-alanine carboxypeptidase [Crossiella cryophila]